MIFRARADRPGGNLHERPDYPSAGPPHEKVRNLAHAHRHAREAVARRASARNLHLLAITYHDIGCPGRAIDTMRYAAGVARNPLTDPRLAPLIQEHLQDLLQQWKESPSPDF